MKNKLYYFFISLIFILIIITVAYLSRYTTFFCDDAGYLSFGLWSSLNPFSKDSAFYIHGGGYICLFLTRFFNIYLPNKLNIHPADFVCSYLGFIKGIIVAIILAMSAKFAIINNKSKLLFISAYLFTAAYFIFSVIFHHSFVIAITHSFFRYIFPILFFIILVNYFYKVIFFNYKPSMLKLFFIILCTFFAGTSNELIFYPLLFSCCMILMFNFIKKYNLNRFFYLPFISLLISITIYVFSPGSIIVMSERGLSKFLITFDNIKEFTHVFLYNYIFNDIYVYVFYIIITFISFYFAVKNKKLKEFCFIFFVQLSFLLVIYSLIFCGKTFYDEGEYWLVHNNIKLFYKFINLIPLFMYLDFVVNNTTAYKNKLFINLILIASSIIYIFLITKHIDNNFFYGKNGKFFIVRSNVYIVEKMTRFFYLSGKEKNIFLPTVLNNPKQEYYLWNMGFTREKINKNCAKNITLSMYYFDVYKDNLIFNYPICFIDDAIEKYYSLGGVFTYDELNNLKFHKLKDKDFIFNKNVNKSNIIQINDINDYLMPVTK